MFADLVPAENRPRWMDDPIVGSRPGVKSWASERLALFAAIAFGPPIALGSLFIVLGWIGRGFRKSN